MRLHSLLVGAVGIGLANGGPQIALMPRLRLGDGGLALNLGVGLSAGPHADTVGFECDNDCSYRKGFMAWGNLELGFTITAGWFSLRAFGGYGWMLAPGTLDCVELESGPCDVNNFDNGLPYGGIQVGTGV